MIALCNQTGKNGWFNIPVGATDDYIKNMADLLHETMSPNETIYIEYSNEVWNSSFSRSAASDQPTTPGAVFACLLILRLCAMKAGTVRRDFKKNREVNPRYSRSGSTSPICFHGSGGGNTGPSLDEQHVRLTSHCSH